MDQKETNTGVLRDETLFHKLVIILKLGLISLLRNQRMKLSYNHRVILVMIVLITILILTPGFYRNEWQAAGRKLFFDWRTTQERMVLARLVQSRQSDIFSYGALLGAWDPASPSMKLDAQQIYLENGQLETYIPYTSHPALQGVLFGLFDQVFDLRPKLNLNLFHGAVSVLSAFVFGLLIYWIIIELGWSAGILTLLFIFFSDWITLFAGNIFWNLWSFYLPFVAVSLYLMDTSATEKYEQRTIGIILFLTILIKCLFTGFEYITTALIMPLIPLIFYAVRDSWGWSKLVIRGIWASMSLAAGVMVATATLIWQIMQVQGSFQEAVTTLMHTLGRRTYGDPTVYFIEADSLRAKLWPVLLSYIQGRAVLLTQVLHIRSVTIEVNYLALFILFLLCTLLLVFLMKLQVNAGNKAVIYALLITTWASLVAPLSWFIVFKAHSFIHTQMNFIIWQMPFTLYGFALGGYTLKMLFETLRTKKTASIHKSKLEVENP